MLPSLIHKSEMSQNHRWSRTIWVRRYERDWTLYTWASPQVHELISAEVGHHVTYLPTRGRLGEEQWMRFFSPHAILLCRLGPRQALPIGGVRGGWKTEGREKDLSASSRHPRCFLFPWAYPPQLFFHLQQMKQLEFSDFVPPHLPRTSFNIPSQNYQL